MHRLIISSQLFVSWLASWTKSAWSTQWRKIACFVHIFVLSFNVQAIPEKGKTQEQKGLGSLSSGRVSTCVSGNEVQ